MRVKEKTHLQLCMLLVDRHLLKTEMPLVDFLRLLLLSVCHCVTLRLPLDYPFVIFRFSVSSSTNYSKSSSSFSSLPGLLILPSVICLRRGGKAEVVIEEADSEESIESDFACPEQFGYYPDQSNCSRYHLCDHGKATVKSCDSGLYFSTILKTCDWPYNVQCADGNRGNAWLL